MKVFASLLLNVAAVALLGLLSPEASKYLAALEIQGFRLGGVTRSI